MRHLMLSLLPLSLMACAQSPVPGMAQSGVANAESPASSDLSLAEKIERGRAIASRDCASCHASAGEEAEWPDAPPLQNLLADYESDTLNEEFRQSLTVGHPGMPQYLYGPKTADLLLAYLVSIQEPAPEAPASED